MASGAAESAVGFFDSGIGGTCILNAFERLRPCESTIYLADFANAPYGNRPAAEIAEISERNAAALLERGCKAVVVACNTATTAAIGALRAAHPGVPFVGVEPAVKTAALATKTGVVAVLATAGTLSGGHYRTTKARFASGAKVIAATADEFVEMVERGETSGPAAEEAVRRRIAPLVTAGCDVIVLGCTHFPHLAGLIRKAAPGVAVIDPSEAVARRLAQVLAERGLEAPPDAVPRREFLTTGPWEGLRPWKAFSHT